MILCSGETPREVVATLRWISGYVCDRTYMTDPSSQCAVSRIWPNLCFSLCGIVLSWCYSDIPSQIGSLLCKVHLLSCQTVFPIFWISRIPLIAQTPANSPPCDRAFKSNYMHSLLTSSPTWSPTRQPIVNGSCLRKSWVSPATHDCHESSAPVWGLNTNSVSVHLYMCHGQNIGYFSLKTWCLYHTSYHVLTMARMRLV